MCTTCSTVGISGLILKLSVFPRMSALADLKMAPRSPRDQKNVIWFKFLVLNLLSLLASRWQINYFIEIFRFFCFLVHKLSLQKYQTPSHCRQRIFRVLPTKAALCNAMRWFLPFPYQLRQLTPNSSPKSSVRHAAHPMRPLISLPLLLNGFGTISFRCHFSRGNSPSCNVCSQRAVGGMHSLLHELSHYCW